MGAKILAVIMVFISIAATQSYGQKSDSIPLYTSDQLELNASMFKPLSGDYQELSYNNEGKAELIGYIIIRLDHSQDWGEKSFMIDWHRMSGIATGNDRVITNQNLGTRMRNFPSSGFPGGIITENHEYSGYADVMFTHPNRHENLDTTFSFSGSEDKFQFNKVYRKEKTYENTHNVITWPYVISAINWTENKDIIMPGFSAFGLKEFYYRLIYLGETTYTDANGKVHKALKVAGIRTDSLEKIRNASLDDPIPRTIYYVSKEAPYYFGKESYRRIKDGKPVLTGTEQILDFEMSKISHFNHLKEIMEVSEQELAPLRSMIKWVDK